MHRVAGLRTAYEWVGIGRIGRIGPIDTKADIEVGVCPYAYPLVNTRNASPLWFRIPTRSGLRGLMEKLGRGSVLIQKACEERGLPKPTWSSEEGRGVTLTFYTPKEIPEVTMEVMRVVAAVDAEMSRKELQQKLGLKNDDHFRRAYIHPALAANYIDMTIPDKPQSSKQRYRITELGRNALQRIII